MSIRQIQYLVAALIFALVFVCVGYLGHAASSGAEGTTSFSRWATGTTYRSSVLMWVAIGAMVGLGVKFAFNDHKRASED